jgi:phosphatidylserine/phosphatidylglycerophosphate/cardiolipin synthase-like enzyme
MAKEWLLRFTDTDPASPLGDGRPWGDGTAMAARAAQHRDPWDAECKVTPLIGGFATTTWLRNDLRQVINDAKAAGKPGDNLGHVYICGYRINPLRDLSTNNSWDPATGWKVVDKADADETAAGLVLRLMQAGLLVRILAWMPTQWERDRGGYVPHCEEHIWLAEMAKAETARLRQQYPALADKDPIGLCALDARVGPGNEAGAHHQKFVVIRTPHLDVAYVGGVDLAFTRRDAPADTKNFDPTKPPAFNAGDWQSAGHMPRVTDGWPHDATTKYDALKNLKPSAHPSGTDLPAKVYGDARQRWHDQHLRLEGPIVKSIEEHFTERWIRTGHTWDVTKRRDNWKWGDVLLSDWSGKPTDPIPRPPVGADIAADKGSSRVQLWRTVPLPYLTPAEADILRRGEFTVLAGLANALAQASELVWVFDQYFWSLGYARLLNKQLREKPSLYAIIILPPHADDPTIPGEQHWARHHALDALTAGVTDPTTRIGVFDLWGNSDTQHGIYCHAKSHTYDGALLAVGSANVNRRSYLGDSEIVCAVADDAVVAAHQRTLWGLLFSGTGKPWPNVNLNTAGAGKTFFTAFTAAADAKSYLITDPWNTASPTLPGNIARTEHHGPMYDFLYARFDYSSVAEGVEANSADLQQMYERLERKSGSKRDPWPFRKAAK